LGFLDPDRSRPAATFQLRKHSFMRCFRRVGRGTATSDPHGPHFRRPWRWYKTDFSSCVAESAGKTGASGPKTAKQPSHRLRQESPVQQKLWTLHQIKNRTTIDWQKLAGRNAAQNSNYKTPRFGVFIGKKRTFWGFWTPAAADPPPHSNDENIHLCASFGA
jgi:hypothetical protein